LPSFLIDCSSESWSELCVWSDKCQVAFEEIKLILHSEPVLLAPDFNKQFKLYVDASDIGFGAVLLQEDEEGHDHPICFYSRKFNCHQHNYCTSEKETLALILSLQHFEVYLSSTVAPVLVFTDHNPLAYIQHIIKSCCVGVCSFKSFS